MLGPSADGEFMRTDFAPRITAPSSHFFPTSTPALLSASSGRPDSSARCSRCAGPSRPWRPSSRPSCRAISCPDGLDGSKVVRRHEHAVVGHIAEQSREDIHVRHTRERVLRPLREVQHRDLAVLLLHLCRCHPVPSSRLTCSGTCLASFGGRPVCPRGSVPAAPPAARTGLENRRIGQVRDRGNPACPSRPRLSPSAVPASVNSAVAAVRPAPAVFRKPRRSTVPSVRVSSVMIRSSRYFPCTPGAPQTRSGSHRRQGPSCATAILRRNDDDVLPAVAAEERHRRRLLRRRRSSRPSRDPHRRLRRTTSSFAHRHARQCSYTGSIVSIRNSAFHGLLNCPAHAARPPRVGPGGQHQPVGHRRDPLLVVSRARAGADRRVRRRDLPDLSDAGRDDDVGNRRAAAVIGDHGQRQTRAHRAGPHRARHAALRDPGANDSQVGAASRTGRELHMPHWPSSA